MLGGEGVWQGDTTFMQQRGLACRVWERHIRQGYWLNVASCSCFGPHVDTMAEPHSLPYTVFETYSVQ